MRHPDIVEASRKYLSPKTPITVRHLYYKLRTDSSRILARYKQSRGHGYEQVSKALEGARREGEIDWDCICENGRQAITALTWESRAEWKRWLQQYSFRQTINTGLEVWVEKDAILSPALRSLCIHHQVVLQSASGQTSATCLHIAELRKPRLIAYFGDLDKAGKKIQKNIEKWLRPMDRLGLTEKDVKRFDVQDDPEVDVLDDDEIVERASKWIGRNL